MLTLVIFLLIKKIRRLKLQRAAAAITTKCAFLILVICLQQVKGQHVSDDFTRHYEIRHNGAAKGNMSVIQSIENGIVKVRIESHFVLRMLIPVSIKAIEEASFNNGIMTYSYIDRMVNGKQKVKQRFMARGDRYEWSEGNKELPKYPVRQTMLSLYFQEPKELRSVFSDAYRSDIPVTNVGSGRYRLDFPNGNSSFYSYSGGICTIVDVHHSLFHIQFLLKN